MSPLFLHSTTLFYLSITGTRNPVSSFFFFFYGKISHLIQDNRRHPYSSFT
ncbi:hypothetical protein Hanom_Chr07g00580181 [Helianthus anomalus]